MGVNYSIWKSITFALVILREVNYIRLSLHCRDCTKALLNDQEKTAGKGICVVQLLELSKSCLDVHRNNGIRPRVFE